VGIILETDCIKAIGRQREKGNPDFLGSHLDLAEWIILGIIGNDCSRYASFFDG
jgi:hypothetical protein